MKLNHIVRNLVIVALIVCAVGLVAFAPFQGDTPPASVVDPLTVPDYVPVILTAVISFLLTAGIKSLSEAVPSLPNLQGQATAITGAVVAILVTLANTFLALVPPELAPLIVGIFGTIGSILSMYGIAGIIKGFQKPKTATK